MTWEKVCEGFALFPEDATDAVELLKLADARMYLRKAERIAAQDAER